MSSEDVYHGVHMSHDETNPDDEVYEESQELSEPLLGEVVDDDKYEKPKIRSIDRPLNRRDKLGRRILTTKQAAMLKILSDPAYHGKKLQVKCDAANVSRKHW